MIKDQLISEHMSNKSFQLESIYTLELEMKILLFCINQWNIWDLDLKCEINHQRLNFVFNG